MVPDQLSMLITVAAWLGVGLASGRVLPKCRVDELGLKPVNALCLRC